MGRYFLNIRNGTGYVPDPEGQILADLDAARRQAIDGVRSVISEEVRQGHLDLSGRIEIADDAGNLLLIVPFRDAVDVRPDKDVR